MYAVFYLAYDRTTYWVYHLWDVHLPSCHHVEHFQPFLFSPLLQTLFDTSGALFSSVLLLRFMMHYQRDLCGFSMNFRSCPHLDAWRERKSKTGLNAAAACIRKCRFTLPAESSPVSELCLDHATYLNLKVLHLIRLHAYRMQTSSPPSP